MTIRVCVAGATGWTGRAVAEGILASDDLALVSAVSRSAAGKDLGVAWGGTPVGVPAYATVDEALTGVDVLVDYTSAQSSQAIVSAAVSRGVGVVVGSSGLSATELSDLGAQAEAAGVGIIAGGNFSLTAAMAQMAALRAARHIHHWEVLDFASEQKPDAPSGGAREIAERLSEVAAPVTEIPIEETVGLIEARGARVAGTQVHSVRLPGYVGSTEVIFGLPGERLTIRYDGGDSPLPYVYGTLLAVRAVMNRVGLTRGLDLLLDDLPG